MTMQNPTGTGTEVFFSYAHEDKKLRDELAKHLSLLKRQGFLRDWHDREITAGTEWKGQIDSHLQSAHIILLLISSDFLTSEYCFDVETKCAMERHKAGEARVIPVILRPVDWTGAPFSMLQALPTDAKPVTKWKNRDDAFQDIARGIRTALEEMGATPLNTSASAPPPADADACYNLGLTRLSQDDYDGALDAFTQTLRLQPTMSYAFYNRGLAYFYKGDDERAIADFQSALGLGFEHALVYRNRGNAYSRRGNVQAALSDYARAIELEPSNALAYLNRGEVYANTLQREQAIADYKKVLSLHCPEALQQAARQRLLALGEGAEGADGASPGPAAV
jgi:tetratricopeptide (TPR) repeat protein